MHKEKLWAEIMRQNPGWKNDGPHFTLRGLRKLFDLVYDRAYVQGQVNGEAFSNPLQSLFGKAD